MQKTYYELRISDGSSDVCSSDLSFIENALCEMAGYGITCQLFCQSFNDVFGKYGVHTSIFDNMHITVSFSTSEPKSIKSIIERAGKHLEYRESFSDPRSLFHKGNRSTSLGAQERYILGEQPVRGLATKIGTAAGRERGCQ